MDVNDTGARTAREGRQDSAMGCLDERAKRLVDHIALIRGQVRADLTPTFGQVDTLFELADDVTAELARNEPVVPCAIASCGRPSEMQVHDRWYCRRCGRAMTIVATQVTEDAPVIAQGRVEAMVMGRAAWPVAAERAR